jgi:hypothetical protein
MQPRPLFLRRKAGTGIATAYAFAPTRPLLYATHAPSAESTVPQAVKD